MFCFQDCLQNPVATDGQAQKEETQAVYMIFVLMWYILLVSYLIFNYTILFGIDL